MKVKRKIIEIDEELCDGCGQCVIACAEGAIKIIDGKARLVSEKYCDGLGACIGECPQGAIKIVEREAEEFDEEAVEAYLKEIEAEKERTTKFECPSSKPKVLQPEKPLMDVESTEEVVSHLGHWPVQIKLIPPNASFLNNAHLLVTADCVPVAYPMLHQRFLKDKVIMLGCPKFDNVEEYVKKFSDIFKLNNIKKVTVLVMEVPCCAALPIIVKKGMEMANVDVEIEQIVISTKGKVLSKKIL